jgi:hypothetical protein
MTDLYRARTTFTGMIGGPGVATFYFLDDISFYTSLNSFWDTLKTVMPDDVMITVEAFGDIIDDATGTITGAWTDTPVAGRLGTRAENYAAPAGILMSWNTATILDGRRVRGHTFVVPATSNNFDSIGHVAAGSITAVQAAGAALQFEQHDSFVIWHRPRAARAATPKLKALTAHAGGHALVTSAAVSPRVCVLRSRRQ